MKNVDKPISRVKCTVAECVHHVKDDSCKAEGIQISPESAHTVEETGCSTFECKS
jgi:hypothetical protein